MIWSVWDWRPHSEPSPPSALRGFDEIKEEMDK